ncbi:hypothetical protein ATCC90586_004522 [Pythium insidiosum]|nr:hypothetical protein ATCC90586_004522 [Pythium insidiosum]
MHALYTVDRTVTKSLDGKTPYEALFDEIPDVSHLRTSGCLAYATLLVTHGLRQRMGIDCFETHAPIVRFESIRTVLYYALWRQWEILQYDVKTAFLHGDLDEQVYMQLPPGHLAHATGYLGQFNATFEWRHFMKAKRLEDVASAIEFMYERKNIGKIVVDLTQPHQATAKL